MLLIICFIIIVIYLVLITFINSGFDKVEDFKLQDLKPETKFSVIIPFRNEAKNFKNLLTCINALNYPKSHFEVILVNDASTDNWQTIFNSLKPTKANNITVINNTRVSNSPKKDAISSAIKIAKHDWVITTDADCILPKYWLDTYDAYIQTKKPLAIAAPVKFTGKSSFFNRYQIIDTLSLQGVTIGAFGIKKPFMCNGANFGYTKIAFESVSGFDGNDKIASGDDVFLLQKLIQKDKKSVHFLKNKQAIVTTQVADNFSDFVHQRLRWASKSSHYSTFFPKFLGIIVLLCNLLMVVLMPLYFFGFLSVKAVLLLYLIKFSIDLLLIFKTSRFFGQAPVLLSYFFVSLLHPFITIYILIQLCFTDYKWKGRRFKIIIK